MDNTTAVPTAYQFSTDGLIRRPLCHLYRVTPRRIPENSTIKTLCTYATGNGIIAIYIVYSRNFSIVSLFLRLTALNFTYLVTAGLLTIFHRLYTSPLRKFPGPKLAALSKLWAANEYCHGRTSLTVRSLHENTIRTLRQLAQTRLVSGMWMRQTRYSRKVMEGGHSAR
jgi:hypothetical protein